MSSNYITFAISINSEEKDKIKFLNNLKKNRELSKFINSLLDKEMRNKNSISFLKKQLKEIEEEYKLKKEETTNELKRIKSINKFKFNISKDEADYLIDSEKLIKEKPFITLKRIEKFKYLFSKELNEKEFFKLIKLAKKKYPKGGHYIENIL